MNTPRHIINSAPYQQAFKDLEIYIAQVKEGGGSYPTIKEIRRDFIGTQLKSTLHERV